MRVNLSIDQPLRNAHCVFQVNHALLEGEERCERIASIKNAGSWYGSFSGAEMGSGHIGMEAKGVASTANGRSSGGGSDSCLQMQLEDDRLLSDLIQICPSHVDLSRDFLRHLLHVQCEGSIQRAAEFVLECENLGACEEAFLLSHREMLERQREEQAAIEKSRKAIVARWV